MTIEITDNSEEYGVIAAALGEIIAGITIMKFGREGINVVIPKISLTR